MSLETQGLDLCTLLLTGRCPLMFSSHLLSFFLLLLCPGPGLGWLPPQTSGFLLGTTEWLRPPPKPHYYIAEVSQMCLTPHTSPICVELALIPTLPVRCCSPGYRPYANCPFSGTWLLPVLPHLLLLPLVAPKGLTTDTALPPPTCPGPTYMPAGVFSCWGPAHASKDTPTHPSSALSHSEKYTTTLRKTAFPVLTAESVFNTICLVPSQRSPKCAMPV